MCFDMNYRVWTNLTEELNHEKHSKQILKIFTKAL